MLCCFGGSLYLTTLDSYDQTLPYIRRYTYIYICVYLYITVPHQASKQASKAPLPHASHGMERLGPLVCSSAGVENIVLRNHVGPHLAQAVSNGSWQLEIYCRANTKYTKPQLL